MEKAYKCKFKTPVTHYPEEYDFPDKLYQPHWEKADAWGIVGIKEGEQELLACIETCPEEWSNRLMVTELWVHEDLRRQGVAHALMSRAKEQAVRENRRAVILETQSCNVGAISFYQQEGFEMIGFDTCCYTNRDMERKEVRINMGYFPEKRDERSLKMEEQKVLIRPLSPELCEDWLWFFDKIAFQDHEDWAFCYCLEGYLDRETQEKWIDAKERREKAIELIQAGEMKGYLAYLDNKVVGWCNANDREKYRYLTEMFRETGHQPKEAEDVKVKAIFCFLVAPEYRGKGVAKSLLNRVCEDALKDGYDYIEAYPFADDKLEFQYHGTSKMYERSGFMEEADLKFMKVMQKKLK